MGLNQAGISCKIFIGRLVRLLFKAVSPKMILPVLRGRLRGKLWITESSLQRCWLGSYEDEERVLFEKTVRKGSIVFDIGAHVGFYTLLASVLVGSEGKVVSFEPVPGNLLYLYEHLRINNVSNVRVIEKAVSDRCGTVYFKTNSFSSMGHFQQDGNLKVDAISLDELIAKQAIPIPNFIKIDVEGAEYLVLSGARMLLEANKVVVFLSTHNIDVHRKCCDLLKSMNYELKAIGARAIEYADTIIAYK